MQINKKTPLKAGFFYMLKNGNYSIITFLTTLLLLLSVIAAK